MKMTHAIWMKDTASLAHPRSPDLKAIDAALLAYEKALAESKGSVLAEKKALQQALELWKASQKKKGQDWKASVRNKLKAVERLDAELGAVIMGAGGLNNRGELMIDPEELRAAKVLAEAYKTNTRRMFSGQRLTVKPMKALADLNAVRGALGEFRTASKEIRDGVKGVVAPNVSTQVQQTLVNLFGDAAASEVREALGPTFFDILSDVTPFVGAIKSGGQALMKWGQTAKAYYAKHQMQGAALSFAPGDPSAAFEAILRIQQREVNSYATEGSIYTISATAKAAFTAADFGAVSTPVMSAAEKLALLMHKIYLFARDWREMKTANDLLMAGVADLSLFRACPLLGCYLIANSDTSAVINMAVGDYGKPGWKFEVEMMVKKAQPVFEKANAVIRESRFEIAGMRGMKGGATNRNATTLGLPTGKLQGAIDDLSAKVSRIVS